jgi:tetratricopeptide (TPR) repeat protein
MKECKSCGSPLEGNPLASQWKCTYCGTVTYNEEYVSLYAKNIDFSKAHHLLQVGIAAYEGREYAKAQDAFERVLMEDSRSRDAWVYGALAIAHLSDLSNLDKSMSGVESYLKKARDVGGAAEILEVGESVACNVLGRILFRAIRRHRELAEKKYFAFESVDRAKAQRNREDEMRPLFGYAEYVFENPPDDPSIMGPIAVEVLLASRAGGCPAPIKNSANAALEMIKNKNPGYYQSLASVLNPPKKSTGCGASNAAFLVIVLGSVFCWVEKIRQ